MDTITRSLHLGHERKTDFIAHIHLIDLLNVPLLEGDCRIKWRFQSGLNLNATNNDKVLGRALQTSKKYIVAYREAEQERLKGLSKSKSSAQAAQDRTVQEGYTSGSALNVSSSGEGDHHHSSHGLGERFKDALFHPQRTLRASTSSHFSPSSQSPRSRAQSVPGSSPLSPSSSISTRPSYSSPRYTNVTRQTTSTTVGRHSGIPVNTTPPPSPPAVQGHYSTPHRNRATESPNVLSPVETARPPYSPRDSSPAVKSRQATGISPADKPPTPPHDAPPRSHTALGSQLNSFGLPSKAETKGKTPYRELKNHSAHFNQHIVCAVGIPMQKNSQQLEESIVKLKITYKIRATPAPHKIGSRPVAALMGGREDTSEASSNASSVSRTLTTKTRINGSNVSVSTTPIGSGSSTPLVHLKESHEEIHLGDLWLNLSEFVSADMGQLENGRRSSRSRNENWTTRRFLLQNGRTNALIRVAVKMDWLSGVREFVAPPLAKGQILSPKKKGSRTSRDHQRDSDRGSIYSTTSGNSRIYSQGTGAAASTSALSVASVGTSDAGSQKKAPSVAGAEAAGSFKDQSDEGHARTNYAQLLGLDEHVIPEAEAGEYMFVDTYLEEAEKRSPSGSIFRKARARNGALGGQGRIHSTGQLVQSDGTGQLVQGRSPAQALAFLHRSKDKARAKQLSQLGVESPKDRKRGWSAPSRSASTPVMSESGSRPSTPLSHMFVRDHHKVDQNRHSHLSETPNHTHTHHHHHHPPPVPVLVHVPTSQEALDIRSHPFRLGGRHVSDSPGIHSPGTPYAMHMAHHDRDPSLHFSLDSTHSLYGATARDFQTDASGIIAAKTLPPNRGRSGESDSKENASTSQFFKNPFKKRSTSNLSAAVAEGSKHPELGQAVPARRSADLPRGSHDLQRTLRPGQRDPILSDNKLVRTRSPVSMTEAEEYALKTSLRDAFKGKRGIDHPNGATHITDTPLLETPPISETRQSYFPPDSPSMFSDYDHDDDTSWARMTDEKYRALTTGPAYEARKEWILRRVDEVGRERAEQEARLREKENAEKAARKAWVVDRALELDREQDEQDRIREERKQAGAADSAARKDWDLEKSDEYMRERLEKERLLAEDDASREEFKKTVFRRVEEGQRAREERRRVRQQEAQRSLQSSQGSSMQSSRSVSPDFMLSRRPTNVEEVSARAQLLRDRGLLPKLTLTTEENVTTSQGITSPLAMSSLG